MLHTIELVGGGLVIGSTIGLWLALVWAAGRYLNRR